ncbi:hypothetical protein [Sphingobium estronivorans]|uniref:hypothetical protein n=1 Tax=Sphingobium estronivorans TaxID=1577690 RepID=UPI0013C35C05|nr:hypothetical protein [Sphingobium estronivorans]
MPSACRTAGRPRYISIDGTALSDIILTNFDKGRSYAGTVRFDKSFNFGLAISAAYS